LQSLTELDERTRDDDIVADSSALRAVLGRA
jgi:hypothetical protein